MRSRRRRVGSGMAAMCCQAGRRTRCSTACARAFINPFAVILFVLASISFVTDVLLASNFSRDMTTVIIILSMLLISGGVRFIQEMRAKRVADRLTEMIASEVLAYRYGQWVGLSSTELVVGDTVRLLARGPCSRRIFA